MLQRLVFRDARARGWQEYRDPLEVILARDLHDVRPALVEVARRVDHEGLHAAGFVTYESAPAFDPALHTQAPGPLPLVCFGLFERANPIERLDSSPEPALVPAWTLDIDPAAYARVIGSIKAQIAAGNSYQVNFTARKRCAEAGDAWFLFRRIAGDAGYAAYIEATGFAVVSASPELFFDLDGERIVCRPMKGTARRGMTLVADREIARQLAGSPKNRAENIMITDMMRNDLGRIAEPGSVIAESLCALEKYATVWQLTSTVSARTRATVPDIFAALFPCASVTGAPKASSMGIIAGLESSPRGIYTGAIGRILPGRRATFSVAIRTAEVDLRNGTGSYGVGGGIVWDSAAEDEYRECLAKARVLDVTTPMPGEFELLETLLWTPDTGFRLLDRHLARLAASASYFGFEVDINEVAERLLAVGSKLRQTAQRVRLTVSCGGKARIETRQATASRAPWRLRLATAPIDANDPFLYHKTTWRGAYDRAAAAVDDADDVVLWNAAGEVTETTIANLVVRIDGRRYTPPVTCGLLAGTQRGWLLDRGEVEERSIKVNELLAAEEVTLTNAVRGEFPAEIVAGPHRGRGTL